MLPRPLPLILQSLKTLHMFLLGAYDGHPNYIAVTQQVEAFRKEQGIESLADLGRYLIEVEIGDMSAANAMPVPGPKALALTEASLSFTHGARRLSIGSPKS